MVGSVPRFWTLVFLSGCIHSKRLEALWKLESIIDNRSPSFLGSHRTNIFHITLYTVYSMDCFPRKIQRNHTEIIVEEDSQQMPYKLLCWSTNLQLLLLLEHCLWTCLLLCTSRSHLSNVSFVAEKTHPDMFSLTLTLPYMLMIVYVSHVFMSELQVAFVVGLHIQLFVKWRVILFDKN